MADASTSSAALVLPEGGQAEGPGVYVGILDKWAKARGVSAWRSRWVQLAPASGQLLTMDVSTGAARPAPSDPRWKPLGAAQELTVEQTTAFSRPCLRLTTPAGKSRYFSSHSSAIDLIFWFEALACAKNGDPVLSPTEAARSRSQSRSRSRSAAQAQARALQEAALAADSPSSSSSSSSSGVVSGESKSLSETETETETESETETDESEEESEDGPQRFTVEPVVDSLIRFQVYETPQHVVLVGRSSQDRWRILKLDRTVAQPESLADVVTVDPTDYSRGDMHDLLVMLRDGNDGQLRLLLDDVRAVLGCVRFLDCLYLHVVTQARPAGAIGSNMLYCPTQVELCPIRPARDNGEPAQAGGWALSALAKLSASLNSRLNSSAQEIAEGRYLALFQLLNTTNGDFFFSPTLDVTRTLQSLSHSAGSFPAPPCEHMYAWNHSQMQELDALDDGWTVPLVHGSFVQRRCSVFGRTLVVSLLARRSRFFAGTRYLKRGTSTDGHVANDVEVEQIVEADGRFSSFVQVRGSIPVFWSQETSVTNPKPPIVINRLDPAYKATEMHFADLVRRYGSPPVIILNLVKQQEKRRREFYVGREFDHAVRYLNSFMPEEQQLLYVALDFTRASKSKEVRVMKWLASVADWSLGLTGFFCSSATGAGRAAARAQNRAAAPAPVPAPRRRSVDDDDGHGMATLLSGRRVRVPSWPPVLPEDITSGAGAPSDSGEPAAPAVEPPAAPAAGAAGAAGAPAPAPARRRRRKKNKGRKKTYKKKIKTTYQRGVVRTNCIDCLDRTNVAQFCLGVQALGKQLFALGLARSEDLYSSSMLQVLMELYSETGDRIALQYGGSEAHKKVDGGSSTHKHREFLTSVRRYYSNAFTDFVKQDAMNLFLGHFVPRGDRVPLWELESDAFLHNFDVQRGSYHTQMARQLGNDALRDPSVAEAIKARMEAALLPTRWWDEALALHQQGQMWMRLGPPSSNRAVDRYDRFHHCRELTEFDDLFSHEFFQPRELARDVRTSAELSASASSSSVAQQAAAQQAAHAAATAAAAAAAAPASPAPGTPDVQAALANADLGPATPQDKNSTIRRYMKLMAVRARAALTSAMRPGAQGAQRDALGRGGGHGPLFSSQAAADADSETRRFFEDYVALAESPARLAEEVPGHRAEYEGFLAECTLESDDAEGVRAAQAAGHATRVLASGPWAGMSQFQSAMALDHQARVSDEELADEYAALLDVDVGVDACLGSVDDGVDGVDGEWGSAPGARPGGAGSAGRVGEAAAERPHIREEDAQFLWVNEAAARTGFVEMLYEYDGEPEPAMEARYAFATSRMAAAAEAVSVGVGGSSG